MSENPAVVLIIEDEPPIRRFLRAALAEEGYRIEETETGLQGLKSATAHPPDLVLLDLGLPDIDGLEVIRRLREWSQVPVIVLSARGQERDKVSALDSGADDYLTKPFGVGELLARLRVAMRHATHPPEQFPAAQFAVADLKVDLLARKVQVRGTEVHLTPMEYRLLTLLVRNAGKVLTHRQLLKEVWGPQYVHDTHYVRVLMAGLRRKLELDPARPRYLLTEQGVGYRLADE